MKRSGMLVVSGANQGFWPQGVDDETSPFLAVTVILQGALEEIMIKETLI